MNEEHKKSQKKSGGGSTFIAYFIIFSMIFALAYIAYQVTLLQYKVEGINISDKKISYVYNKVGDLVKVLNTKETTAQLDYDPNQEYEFKVNENNDDSLTETLVTAQENQEALREELSKMKDSDKLNVIRDRLVDIYQRSKSRGSDLDSLRQSFYETKTVVENWYAENKGGNVKLVNKDEKGKPGFIGKLKNNIDKFVEINKLSENLSKSGRKILTPDQVPEMIKQAESLMESESLSQVNWIMEDLYTITNQQEILDFSANLQNFMEKYPNPNADLHQLKDLIDIIEKRG